MVASFFPLQDKKERRKDRKQGKPLLFPHHFLWREKKKEKKPCMVVFGLTSLHEKKERLLCSSKPPSTLDIDLSETSSGSR